LRPAVEIRKVQGEAGTASRRSTPPDVSCLASLIGGEP
jgi:hypothetical protein